MHRAVLPNGQRVAVKVQRPDAPRQIEADLALLYQAARIAKDRVRALDFIDARELVDEFARSIRAGARLPGRGAERADVPPATSPGTRTSRCRTCTGATRVQRVLTLEFLDGTQLADLDSARTRSTSAGASRT